MYEAQPPFIKKRIEALFIYLKIILILLSILLNLLLLKDSNNIRCLKPLKTLVFKYFL